MDFLKKTKIEENSDKNKKSEKSENSENYLKILDKHQHQKVRHRPSLVRADNFLQVMPIKSPGPIAYCSAETPPAIN